MLNHGWPRFAFVVLATLSACGGDGPNPPDTMGDDISEISSTFSGSTLPTFLINGVIPVGASATVRNGKLEIVGGSSVGGTAVVFSAARHALTTNGVYVRMFPVEGPEPLGGSVDLPDANFDSYGIQVAGTSNVPGSAEIRINRVVAGVIAHDAGQLYNPTNHRWARINRSGNRVFFETAGDSGNGPGAWVPFYSEDWSVRNPGWDHTTVTLYLSSLATTVDMVSQKVTFDGLNANTQD